MDTVDETMDKAAADTVSGLDDARQLLRRVAADAARGGYPPEILWEILRIGNSIQFVESRASEYATKVAA